jgi:hypothetical protein
MIRPIGQAAVPHWWYEPTLTSAHAPGADSRAAPPDREPTTPDSASQDLRPWRANGIDVVQFPRGERSLPRRFELEITHKLMSRFASFELRGEAGPLGTVRQTASNLVLHDEEGRLEAVARKRKDGIYQVEDAQGAPLGSLTRKRGGYSIQNGEGREQARIRRLSEGNLGFRIIVDGSVTGQLRSRGFNLTRWVVDHTEGSRVDPRLLVFLAASMTAELRDSSRRGMQDGIVWGSVA